MMMRLKNRHIVLGVTGSIAAYKIPELIRLLQKQGATVQVMATPSALEFVTKVTLETLSGYPVLTHVFSDRQSETMGMPHIQSSRKADLIVVAPVTANMLAKLAYGMADDIVSSTVLASDVPVLVAPAMNVQMWKNPLVVRNVQELRKAYEMIEPDRGYLACGEYGEGRLVDLQVLVDRIIHALTPQDLKGKKVLMTAGATREYLDPVRFVSNGSSGKMAFALAREAYYRGAQVTVVEGFVQEPFSSLPVNIISVTSAEEMAKTVLENMKGVDIFIAAAAVSDYRFPQISKEKLKKNSVGLTLKMVPTVDVLAKVLQLRRRPFVVGFALETGDILTKARQKLKKKPVDLLVVNSYEAIGADGAKVFFMTLNGVHHYDFLNKEVISENLFTHVVKSF